MDEKNYFKENLKLLRKEASLSQDMLAEKIGVSKAIISLWENGQREPILHHIVLLSKFFNVTSDFLIGLKDC